MSGIAHDWTSSKSLTKRDFEVYGHPRRKSGLIGIPFNIIRMLLMILF